MEFIAIVFLCSVLSFEAALIAFTNWRMVKENQELIVYIYGAAFNKSVLERYVYPARLAMLLAIRKLTLGFFGLFVVLFLTFQVYEFTRGFG